MRKADEATETDWMRKAMHDLSQPLMALECRLYLGTLDTSEEGVREALREGLTQCDRLMECVRAIQMRLV